MKNSRKKMVYWTAQILGWGFIVGFIALAAFYSEEGITRQGMYRLLFLFTQGIITMHLYRFAVIKLKWLNKSINKLVAIGLLSGVVLGFVIFTNQMFFYWLTKEEGFEWPDPVEYVLNAVVWSIVATTWIVGYFAYHFFDKSRKEEIKNLQWEASKNEIELNNLKSQLNPHFMFNSMNSIRALIDEDPQQAKNSITKLSGVLRSTLLMGKKKLVKLDDEISVIKDYLGIEKIRFEERLEVEYLIENDALSGLIPPMLLQTIVENGLKHGIAKLTQGGKISILAGVTNGELHIRVENTGQYDPIGYTDSGIGLSNSLKRLNILYGDKASMSIMNKDAKTVLTEVVIPYQTQETELK